MEAAIVGALLKATLPSLLKLIGDSCKQLEPDVRFIQSELEFMQAAFGDSRWRGNEISDLRRTWILQLRRLAHEIQDCIDSFQIHKTSATQFAHEIADLKKRIQDSSEGLHRYIGQGEPSNGKVAPNPMANDAEEDILAFVQNQSEMNAKVICAIGFGGQNTDLARRVYENDEVCWQFGQRAWVSAVDRTVDDVLTEILRQLERRPGLGMLILSWLLSILCFFQGLLLKVFGTGMTVASRSGVSSGIDHQLRSLLSKERYLIVIHDVTKEEVYNKICAFPWANRVGGRIIVTTDIQSAARPCICGNDPPLLAPDSITSRLVLVGEVGTGMFYKEICSALCDAAVARMQCFVGSDYERIVVEDMLLYFSMFPLHHHVRRNPLIRRWLAEGLLVHAIQKVPENVYRFPQDVAAEHLDILIGQNIVKSIKKSNNGKVKRCQPPGMVFNHICARAVIDNFNTLLCGPSQNETIQEAYVRRFSLHPYMAAANGGLNVPDVHCLHTMVVFPTAGAQYGAILNFDNHKLLRVLDLEECADVTANHVLKICDLLLLKYLSLGSSIKEVPSEIRRLQQLETLDMSTSAVVTVSSNVLKLPKLKHLLGKFRLSRVDCPDENPSMMKKGAKKVKKVLKLKDEFSKLKDFLRDNSVLETLAGIVIGNGMGFPQLLSDMGKLRKVKMWCDSMTNESTDLTGLKEGIKAFTSHRIRTPNVDYSLSVDFSGSSQSFLDCLEDPGMLTLLKLRGNLTHFRPVAAKLVSLQELCLSWTNLSGAAIQTGLSNLRCQLKFLKLVENNLVGLAIQDKDAFVSLERICLVGMQSLEEIIIQDLRKLVSLHLLCPTLGALPGVQIRKLQSLNEVGLHSQVEGDIKRGWEDAAISHKRKLSIVSIGIQ
ncbi:hypothetical protein CFC21_050434 [Triticum aestivum]|uniref:Rx N-terminal domain-containing protein n=2 Tax=Triticum aestivum TaxID=4565 RepID=A0A3B6H6V4_WHEAT|nr:disease resistance protein RGA4-like [Triticum aestivum]XP_044359725.1 disease resistance protein RGA4-like [Triticum aestivum]KAF7040541.1 hypothetical protein CFC21_050434 [Triticum aestivum]